MVVVLSVGGSERNAGNVQLCSGLARLLTGIFLASRNISTSSFVNRHPLATSLCITGETGKMPSQGHLTGVSAQGRVPVAFNTTDGKKKKKNDRRRFCFQKKDLHEKLKNPPLHSIIWLAGAAKAGCKINQLSIRN